MTHHRHMQSPYGLRRYPAKACIQINQLLAMIIVLFVLAVGIISLAPVKSTEAEWIKSLNVTDPVWSTP